ncbi:MAG: class I SAM-dependent methyltransferase [bacterium]
MSPDLGISGVAPEGRPTQGPAARLLAALRPRPGQRFLDLACGPGMFFFPVFEAMEGQGVFLAAEWEEEGLRRFLTRLETYVGHPGYTRVEVMRAKPDRLPLPDRCADLVLLDQDASPSPLVRALPELRRLLAPGGIVCLLGSIPDGIAPLGFAAPGTEQAAGAELAAAGFQWRVSHTGLGGRWCLTARL